MKKIVIIGGGMDVVSKQRGSFLDSNFDEIIIMKRSIYHLDDYKDYLGTPTIWVNGGREWRKYNWITSELEERLKWQEMYNKEININLQHKSYEILAGSKIKEVWLNYLDREDHYPFIPPSNIKITYISGLKNIHKDSTYFCSVGLQTIMYAIAQGYDVYYFGIDSFRKGHHYYPETTYTFVSPESLDPKDVMDYNHKCSNYLREHKEIKNLIKLGKLKHIDTICP